MSSGQYILEAKRWPGDMWASRPLLFGAAGNARQRRRKVRAWRALGYSVKPTAQTKIFAELRRHQSDNELWGEQK